MLCQARLNESISNSRFSSRLESVKKIARAAQAWKYRELRCSSKKKCTGADGEFDVSQDERGFGMAWVRPRKIERHHCNGSLLIEVQRTIVNRYLCRVGTGMVAK